MLKGVLAKPWMPVFVQIDLKDTEISIQDGTTPTPNKLVIRIGEGNLTYTERINRDYILDAGRLDEVRNGDEVPVELRFDLIWDFITAVTSSGVPSPEDALKQRGEASAWVSTDADPCRPYAVAIILDNTPNCVTVDKEVITFTDFRHEQIDHDLRAATLAVNGQCNITEASAVRSPQPT